MIYNYNAVYYIALISNNIVLVVLCNTQATLVYIYITFTRVIYISEANNYMASSQLVT